MSQVIIEASTARKTLARALGHLQGENVPSSLLASAEPIANSMGLLHELECSNGARLKEIAPLALREVQTALAVLQEPSDHPSNIARAMAEVAEALGHVHSLTRVAPTELPPARVVLTTQSIATAGQASFPEPLTNPAPARAIPEDPIAPSHVHQVAPGITQATESVQHVKVSIAPASEGAFVQAPNHDGVPLSVDTSLGAHSSNNFYRGLSGDNILAAGGIFVATYSPPNVGQALSLRILMPGGYEFRAKGIVRWVRDAPQTASTAPYAPPGYGAQLYEVPKEGRGLIERYCRNREPLLHDDL